MKRVLHVNRQTMNAVLPSIPPDFERDMRDMIFSMPAERKDRTMRKKISAGLIVTVVLSLLAVSALAAALLSGGQFAEMIMAPKAAENPSAKYTSREIDEILRIARENNLELDKDDEEYIRNMEEGYYKDELIRLFVKMEYGPKPGAWPLKVQRWYEEMLEACGLGDGYIHSVLPEGDEISQEEAVRIAAEYVTAHGGKGDDLENEALYTRYMTYQEDKLTPAVTARAWWINYRAKDLTHPDYDISLNPQGEVTRYLMLPGVLSVGDNDPAHTVVSRVERQYEDEFGRVTYTSQIMLEEKALLQKLADQRGTKDWSPLYVGILETDYILPDDSMLTREQAIEKAKAACGDLNYYTYRGLGDTALTMRVNGRDVWHIALTLKDSPAPDRGNRVFVQMDARAGTILACDVSLENRPWFQIYFSEESWQAKKAAGYSTPEPYRPAVTARPDGSPGVWGDPKFPDWYWQRLDQVGYNSDTGMALTIQWDNEYGLDSRFWPLEYQAIQEIWDNGAVPEGPFPGLPAENELTQEQSVKIAREKFNEYYASLSSALDVSDAQAGVQFWFNDPEEGVNSYQISFLRGETFLGDVYLNAVTGEVLSMHADGGRDDYYSPSHPIVRLPDGDAYLDSDLMPQSYWAQIRELASKLGVTKENIIEKYRAWCYQYEDEQFLPLENLAVYDAYRPRMAEEPTVLIILPQNGMITREEAVDTAWSTCLALTGDEAYARSLRLSAVLWRESEDEPAHWYIQYWENETLPGGATQWNARVEISLDAHTGEVLISDYSTNSNG